MISLQFSLRSFSFSSSPHELPLFIALSIFYSTASLFSLLLPSSQQLLLRRKTYIYRPDNVIFQIYLIQNNFPPFIHLLIGIFSLESMSEIIGSRANHLSSTLKHVADSNLLQFSFSGYLSALLLTT